MFIHSQVASLVEISQHGPPRAFVKPSPASLPPVRSLYLVNNESLRLCGAVNFKKAARTSGVGILNLNLYTAALSDLRLRGVLAY